MTFAEFWHWVFTSPYSRLLEQENADLKREVKELRVQNHELAKLAMKLRIEHGEVRGVENPPSLGAARRPGKFQSFGQAKRVLENQPEPQRSVTV